jgi:pimeloyl-ACP methyl ester carboxylesterase
VGNESLKALNLYGLPSKIGYRTGASGYDPNRPTLVLIHGAGGSSQSFLPQLRGLDRHLNILVLELPGHGATPGPGKSSISAYAEWVQETLTESPLESFYLGGHSMGGAVSLEIALRFPQKIQGLVLIATGAELKVSPKLLAGLQEQPHLTIEKINQWSYAKGTAPQIIAQSIQLMAQTPISVILEDFKACDQFQQRDEIAHIKIPALILVGDQDMMTPPDSSRFLQEKIPSSRLVIIPGAGHMIMLEKHKEINQTIRDFIIPLN